MPTAKVNGIKLNYSIAGNSEKALLCFHGYSGTSEDYAHQSKGLASKYKVIAIDQRGSGKSDIPKDEKDYSMEIFASDAYELLKQLKVKKCAVAGHSMGGAVALTFYFAHPEMVTGLVMIDTAAQFPLTPEAIKDRNNLCQIGLTQGLEAAFEFDAAHNQQRIDLFKKHPEEREKSRQRLLNNMTPISYKNTWKAIEKWPGLAQRLSEIKVPAIIFWGDEDVGMAQTVQVLKKGIADSELVMVKGVGHNPHYDKPDEVNKHLLAFLGRLKW